MSPVQLAVIAVADDVELLELELRRLLVCTHFMFDHQRRCVESVAFARDMRRILWGRSHRKALIEYAESLQRGAARKDARDIPAQSGGAALIRLGFR